MAFSIQFGNFVRKKTQASKSDNKENVCDQASPSETDCENSETPKHESDTTDIVVSDAEEATEDEPETLEEALQKIRNRNSGIEENNSAQTTSRLSSVDDTYDLVEFPPNLPTSLSLELCDGFAMSRHPALSREEFSLLLDADGRLVNEHKLRQAVFRGGVDPSIRREVWQYLFKLFPFYSTQSEREILQADQYVKYKALKARWKSLLVEESDGKKLLHPTYLEDEGLLAATKGFSHLSNWSGSSHNTDQEKMVPTSRVAEKPMPLPDLPSPDIKQQLAFFEIQAQVYAGRKPVDMESLKTAIRVIDKDVPRTDRDCDYFKGAHNPHLELLRDVLITFAAYHPEVSYAQGMNDILSRFLVVFDSEVEAYWCFTNYLESVQSDFSEEGLLNKLEIVQRLLKEIDTDLWKYLELLGVGDMTFCHRWMLLSFKREFDWENALKCFEILSSHHLELFSMEAERIRDKERRRDFQSIGGKNRLEDVHVNSDYTFDAFMCVTILIENRKKIFDCQDSADVIQFICGLTMNLELDVFLAKSEMLFSKYCRKSVIDSFYIMEHPPIDSQQPLQAETKNSTHRNSQHQDNGRNAKKDSNVDTSESSKMFNRVTVL